MALAELTAALASGKQALDVARLMYEAKDSFKDASAQMQMADLMIKLSDTNLELSKLEHLMLEKDREIADLKKRADIESRLRFVRPSWWLQMPGQEQDDGPFCQRCWDGDRKLIRLQKAGNKYDPALACFQCKAVYEDPSRTAEPMPERSGVNPYY